MISVIIADDQPLMRDGLKYIIERDADIKVLNCAGNGREAFEKCGENPPDVVLMDIVMPGCDGIEGMVLIKSSFPKTRVLMLTTFGDYENIKKAIQAGADGYILKDIAPEDLIIAVKNVNKGLKVIQDEVFRSYVDNREDARDGEKHCGSLKLTERELEVIRLIVRGRSNKEIAAEMGITDGSVRNIISAVLDKTGVQDRTQLAVYSIRNRIV